ncbi:microtubule associated protein 1A/1B, light chain 3 [Oesophagostomum dentatum]|uniref:Microtubule associated protein 1A/1B, light chain 3 n=1 Tax=Oesophagostomum dentatum TaxID=61180 RepID=A0A0B1T506_OESDE|nr:microtubule associated protein 1A/1B, light chain 3 [Oesophagostomum dentatum]
MLAKRAGKGGFELGPCVCNTELQIAPLFAPYPVILQLQLHPEQAFFLLVNEKSVVSNSMTMSQLYQTDRDQDGFLYVVYTSQPAFGSRIGSSADCITNDSHPF